MRYFGLIGKELTHSFSQEYFEYKFAEENIPDAKYNAYPLNNLNNLRDLILSQKLDGFNVTIPYKQKIIPLLDKIDETAQITGAVNTVKVINNNKIQLFGYNTDIIGFQQSLKTFIKNKKHYFKI